MHVFINSVMYNDFKCDNYVFMVDSAIYYPGGMDMLEIVSGKYYTIIVQGGGPARVCVIIP